MFDIDFSLVEARSRLAALDFSSGLSSLPVASDAATPMVSDVSVSSSSAVQAAAADHIALEASAPSITDVRKDIAAKRRLALQQAMQRQ
jgi:hypothetical protein